MKVIIQRVARATVKTQNKTASIKKGFVILVAAKKGDTKEDAEYLAKKIANLRIMADEENLMNKTVEDVDGEMLVISQFTLYARTRKGNRPSFIDAAQPKQASIFYKHLINQLKERKILVKTGEFGSYMQVELVNDGPVTIIIESSDREKSRMSAKKKSSFK